VSSPPSVVFVCLGNICRSPMAEVVARGRAAERGLELQLSSAGVSAEESGNSIDGRARSTLESAGYEVGHHRAHRINADEVLAADMVIAAEQSHIDRMRRLAPEADNFYLIMDFDPQSGPGQPLPDPWYGGIGGFNSTLSAIERAMPAILDEVKTLNR